MKFDFQNSWFSMFEGETFSVTYDFTNDLVSGDTLSSCTVTAEDSTGTDVTATIISGTTVVTPDVTFTVAGVTADTTYQIKLVGISANSNTYIHYLNLDVYGTLTLNQTLGSASANSYVTLEEANKYIASKYGHVSAWDELSFEGKKRVLVEAAEVLNAFNFVGDRYYEVQTMEFPRDDHDVLTGNCATPATLSGCIISNAYSTTYNKYPSNYWKYGTIHITAATPLNDIRMLQTSNVTTGAITVSTDFSGTPTTNTTYKIFAPLYDEVKDAQCEQALFIVKNTGFDSLFSYRSAGARRVKIGDTEVEFNPSMERIAISSVAKKLLSRWIRKYIRIGRG